MSDKAARRAARSLVGEYHEAQQQILVGRIAEAVDRFRAGELDAFEVDEVVFQYSRASKKLWTFCNDSQVEITAMVIGDGEPRDWWERGTVRRRDPSR